VERWLGPHKELIYAVTRIVVGLMYWMHGTTKLFDWPPGARGSGTVAVLTLLGVGAVIETVLGLLITIGLGTRWAAFIASGQMAAAYFLRQAPFAIWPIYQPRGILGESAVFNCFFFLYVAARGAGILSIDGLLAKRQTAGADAPLTQQKAPPRASG
jgi:putative oxidoreductase